MTLKMTVDSLEAVPEPVRSFYEEKEGKYALKVDGVEDVSALKSALEKERENAKAAGAYKELGKTPSEIRQILEERAKAEEEAAKKSGDFDKLREKIVSDYQKQLDDMRAQIELVSKSEREAVINTQLMKHLSEAGATKEGLDLLPRILAGRATIDTVEDKRTVKILDSDGIEMLAGGKPATFADLVQKTIEQYPSLFSAQSLGGSGKPPASNGAGSAKTVTRNQFNGMSQSERREHSLSGGRVVD